MSVAANDQDAARAAPEITPAHRNRDNIAIWHIVILTALLAGWYVLTSQRIIAPFFFGEPIKVFSQIYVWFASGEIWRHLAITLLETIVAFALGLAAGVSVGLWLGLSDFSSRLADPYIKAANSMPRVVLAPIFIIWFGIGIWSKVALGVTLVFFLIFFNVYQGVREANPVVLANAKMLGASYRQLIVRFYLPSALSWVFSSLHTSVGMAFVGAVVGEYLGSSRGIGYLILQAEGVFDINAVIAGILVLTVFALALDRLITFVESRLLSWRAA